MKFIDFLFWSLKDSHSTVLHHHPPNASPKFASFHLNITNHRQQADTQIKEKRNRNKKMLLLNNRQRGAASAQNAVR